MKRAIINNDAERLKALIKSGANLNHEEIDGSTPLMMAIERNSEECIRLLIEEGASISYANYNILNAAHGCV